MAVAMYDVKKCRSICCHKSLSERLVSQSPFGVVIVVAANVVCCLIVLGFLLVGGAVMSPTQLSPCRLKLVLKTCYRRLHISFAREIHS